MTLSPTASLATVRRLAFGSLLANIGIVLTGGAVRLTDSGLGCPTWPRCTEDSWTATAEMGIHGAVEFGNRLLIFVLAALAVAGLLAAWRLNPGRPRLVRLAAAILAGIALQGVIGGVTVRTDLNPWIVGAHFLVSIAIIAVAHTFWRAARDPAHLAPSPAPRALRGLTWLIVAATAALLAVGTVVTGSGPHAGDADVPRNDLDPATLSQFHAHLAFLVLGLAVAAWFTVRATGAGRHASRAAVALVAIILGQGAAGLVQYYTGLPELLVWFHMLGSTLVWVAALELRYGVRVAGSRHRQPSSGPAADDTVGAGARAEHGAGDGTGLVAAGSAGAGGSQV